MSTRSLIDPLSTVYSVPMVHNLDQPASYWGPRFTILILATWLIGLILGFQLSLQVLTFTGFFAAIAGLRFPSIGLLGMSMLCTLDTVSRVMIMRDSQVLHYNTYNYWLLIVMLLSLRWLLGLKDVHTRILQIFLLILGCEIGVSGAWENGLQHVLNILTVFGLLAYFIRANWDKRYWYWLGIVNGVLSAAGGLVFYLQKSQLPEINGNAWAYFPLTGIFAICLGFPFIVNRSRTQTFLGALAIVNYAWVFLSGSRGTLLVATVTIGFLLITASGFSTRLAYTCSFIIAALLLSILFTDLQHNASYRLEKLAEVNRSYVNRTSGRSDLALAAWYMFLDHPLGVGTGGFASTRISEGYVQKTSGWEADTQMEAHAGWMKTLAENGIPGIILQFAYVISFAVVGWHRRRRGVFSIGLLVTLTLSFAFLTTEVQTKGLWFLAAGTVVLLNQKYIFGPTLAIQNQWSTLKPFGVRERLPQESLRYRR